MQKQEFLKQFFNEPTTPAIRFNQNLSHHNSVLFVLRFGRAGAS